MMPLGHPRWQECATGFTKMKKESLLGVLPNYRVFFSCLDPLGDGTQSLREAMAVSKQQIVA